MQQPELLSALNDHRDMITMRLPGVKLEDSHPVFVREVDRQNYQLARLRETTPPQVYVVFPRQPEHRDSHVRLRKIGSEWRVLKVDVDILASCANVLVNRCDNENRKGNGTRSVDLISLPDGVEVLRCYTQSASEQRISRDNEEYYLGCEHHFDDCEKMLRGLEHRQREEQDRLDAVQPSGGERDLFGQLIMSDHWMLHKRY